MSKLVAVVNLSPDSFSDGREWSFENLISHIKTLQKHADILDIGAQSTNPNAKNISPQEELDRLKFFIQAFENCRLPLSIDTFNPNTALYALQHNFKIINCVKSAALPELLPLAKKFDAHLVATFDLNFDCMFDIFRFFLDRRQSYSKIICDPGIGFNKSQAQNKLILQNLDKLKDFNTMLGVSRKSIIGCLTGLPVDQRDAPTAAVCILAALQGVNYLRVHNVQLLKPMLQVLDALSTTAE